MVKLVKNIKEDNLTLVFSRGEESTNESLSRSERLFKELIQELNLGSQEFISIAYDLDIAKNSDIYPMDRMIEKCQVLSDFLCEKDEIEANIFVILNENEDIIKNYIIDRYTKSKNRPLQFFDEDKFLIQVYNQRYYVDYEFNSKIIYKESTWTKFWYSYILYTITNLEGMKGIEELKGKELKEYIHHFNDKNINNKDIISIFKDAIKGKAEYKVILNENDDYKPTIDFEMYDHNITLCIYCDELFENIDGCIKELISVIAWLELNNIYITIKLFIKDPYDNNKKVYDKIKSNVHEINWSQDDILLMIRNIVKTNKVGLYYLYYKQMADLNNLIKGNIDWVKTVNMTKYEKNTSHYSWVDLMKDNNKSYKELISNVADHIVPHGTTHRNPLDLLWGKRITSGKFSKKTSQWVIERLKNLDAMNPLFISVFLHEAIKLQIEKGYWDDRLIDFEILCESFDKIGKEIISLKKHICDKV